MAAFHDMGEAIIGDITPSDGISRGGCRVPERISMEADDSLEDKHVREKLAIQYLSALNRPRNPTFATELESLWDEYEERTTKEARLVHDIDVYERLLQAKEYEVREQGRKDLGDFFVQWEQMITTQEIKEWTESLMREREAFWSSRNPDLQIVFVLGKETHAIDC